nr:vegetative incompatibility protein het-e-1 [Quercus suber]
MEVLGTAVGVASLGIQVCQGLLAYYNDWKDYDSDIKSTYESIASLNRLFISIKASIEDKELDEEKVENVTACLKSCEAALTKLSEKKQKLQKHAKPKGVSEKALRALQQSLYPFRASTLAKLREVVSVVQDRLHIAIDVLHLDVSNRTQKILDNLDRRTSSIEVHVQSIQDVQRSEQSKKIIDWLSAPDPWTNHSSARQKYEPQTGAWLLDSDWYQQWKAGSVNHIWLFGKPGCGKTVLCSTAVEDMKGHCAAIENTALAVFYFTFSDKQKQKYEDLLRSLVAQLGWKEPGLSMLQEAYHKPDSTMLGVNDLEKILIASIQSYNVVFLMLDALDESPEESDIRHDMLDRVEALSQNAANLKIFATSRDYRDVRDWIQAIKARSISIAASAVNVDIQRYISTQLSRDRRFARLDSQTTALIQQTISSKADGMYEDLNLAMLSMPLTFLTGFDGHIVNSSS